MKVLRIIGNIIIGIILFLLIFSLSFIKSTRNSLEKDLILGAVRLSLVEAISNETGKLKANQEEIISEIFNDRETDDFVSMIINNFQSYQNNKASFQISRSDIEKINKYVKKNKSQIIKISGDKIKDISEEEFEKMFSSENINKYANRIFEEISSSIGDEIDDVVNVYNNMTSNKITILLIISIVVFLILLLLINWSLYRWMLVPGICLIISGVLMSIVFFGGIILNEIVRSGKFIQEAIGEINFNSYIIVGIIEIVVGIILIVLYNVLKNKSLNKNIKSLNVAE